MERPTYPVPATAIFKLLNSFITDSPFFHKHLFHTKYLHNRKTTLTLLGSCSGLIEAFEFVVYSFFLILHVETYTHPN